MSISDPNCISYDPSIRSIKITCKYAHLSDIEHQLKIEDGADIVAKTEDGTWLLNAGLIIEKGAVLTIDSKDTKWLKIIADGKIAYPIEVLGSLKIDSVKVTSWNPQTNDYATSEGNRVLNEKLGRYEVKEGFPRPYIRIEEEATGTTNITNSEIAYLGYEAGLGGGVTGLTYLGGDNSVLRNNNIHDLYFAFYSNGVGGMVIENNHIHNNGHYGLDPHTGTHDMLIRNNTVHDNGSTGIICSLNCHNIIIENNTAYNNNDIGIMFSRNMTNSIARNNIVYNETQGIFVSKSHNNEINNNTVYDTKNAIYLKNMSSNNLIHDNVIKNPKSFGIHVNTGASANTFYSNTIILNPSKESKAIVVENETSKDNIFKDNKVIGISSGQ